jgi:hypothetical protein
MALKFDEHLTELALSRDRDALMELASDIISPVLDGTTPYEMFESGYMLRQNVGDADIWVVEDNERNTDIFLFVGPYGATLTKIAALPLKSKVAESFDVRLSKCLK